LILEVRVGFVDIGGESGLLLILEVSGLLLILEGEWVVVDIAGKSG
jgi:hypothetical protein